MATLSRRDSATATAARERAVNAFLDATTALLAEGAAYAELSIDAIARRAGFSRPTFYAHFGDKRGLMLRLGESLGAAIDAEAGPWLRDGEGTVRATLAGILRVFRDQREATIALAESATYDPQVASLWRELHNRFATAARERLQAADPELDADSARARAFALVWMTERSMLEHLQEPQASDEALLDALTLFWTTGLRGDERSTA